LKWHRKTEPIIKVSWRSLKPPWKAAKHF